MARTYCALKASDPYYTTWLDLRRRTFFKWLAVFPGLPLVTAPGWLLGSVLGPIAVWSTLALIPAAVFILGLYAAAWPCPRCKHAFYLERLDGYWPFADHCLHCGLPEYAPNGEQ